MSKKTKEVVWQAAGLMLEDGILKCEICHLTAAETHAVWKGVSRNGSLSCIVEVQWSRKRLL